MALIVETGVGVGNANSYVSAAAARTWAAARGLEFPDDDLTAKQLLTLAFDFIESFRDRFQGTKTGPTQWPRNGVVIDGIPQARDSIPQGVVNAQIQLAIDAQTLDLQPTTTGQTVIESQVDVIRTKFATGGSSQPRFTKALSFLKPTFRDNSGGLSTQRI